MSGLGAVHATKGNLNNDIGVPLTLFKLGEQHQSAVIEMGANHPGEIAYLVNIARPDVAVVRRRLVLSWPNNSTRRFKDVDGATVTPQVLP